MNRKRKTMNCIIAAFTMVTCVGLTSCMDDVYQGGEGTGDTNNFNFSMKKNVEFTLKYNVTAGYRVPFEVYTKVPVTLDGYKSYVKDSTLVPFFSGRCNEDGSVTFKGELPTTVKEIFAYSPGIGSTLLMKASVSGEGIVSTFEKIEVKPASTTRANEGGPSGTTKWTTYTVNLEKPVLAPVSRVITQEDKNMIDKSFEINQDYNLVTTYYQPSIRLIEEAEVKIYSVSHAANSNRTNALAYFVYDKNDDIVKPNDVNSKLNLLFPELNKTIPAEGAGYQLLYNGEKTFKSGSHIGFALFPDINPDNIKTDDTHLLYSCFNTGSWNAYNFPGSVRASVPHMVLSLLRQDSDGHAIIAIGFEDQPWSTSFGSNKGDFRDDIFIVEVTPASSLPGDLPTPPQEDPTYDTEYKTSGILSFEDSWPGKGDYDMNDIIVSYDRSLCVSYKNGPVALKETYTFLHNGATYTNGFGYQLLGLQKSNIQKCTVTSSYVCEGQGQDMTSNEAIVMLFDNGKVIPAGTTFEVYTSFSSGQLLPFANYVNPFIVVKGGSYGTPGNMLSEGRTEVHLPTATQSAMYKFLPTAKSNTSYWGMEDDKSEPGKNIYYVRSGSYPFAFDIAWDSAANGDVTNFVIPEEKLPLEDTYPSFKSWVDSKGSTNKDWYLHPKK